MVSFYEGNENMDENMDEESVNIALLQSINGTDIDNTSKLYTDSLKLVNNSSKILNSLKTDKNTIDTLQNEKRNLQNLFRDITNQQNIIRQQMSSQLSTNANNIKGNVQWQEAWQKTADFKTYNTNKIKSIYVHYNLDIILGIKIIKSNGSELIKGTVTNAQSYTSITFEASEFLTQIEIVSDTSVPGLCKQISFYTNLKGGTAAITFPETIAQQKTSNKEYDFINRNETWAWHRKNAESTGRTLACIADKNENDVIKKLYPTNMWIGLYHQNVDKGIFTGTRSIEDNAGWKWVDGTPYKKANSNWSGGEPNNCCSGEPVINLWWNGTWNDHNYYTKMPALYQKKVSASNTKTAFFSGQQIVNFDFKPIRADYDKIYNLDLEAIKNSEKVTKEMKAAITTMYNTSNVMNSAIISFDGVKNNILKSITSIDNRMNIIFDLNKTGTNYLNDKQGFDNIENNSFSDSLSKLYNMFFNIKEGAVGSMTTSTYGSALGTNKDQVTLNNVKTLTMLDNLKVDQVNSAISEYIIKKDNIFSNVLSDYMLNEEQGTNIENVYNKLNHKNDAKMRKIELDTYYNKAYQEYSKILKVIIVVCIIIVPIIIANKNEIMPNSITMFIIVALIFLTIIYIFYKFADIYMRDKNDFDKIQFTYDRTNSALQKDGITKKKNYLTSLRLGCFGEDCCDSGMVYDYAKYKCIASENFGNYFDKKINEITTSIVEPMNSNVFNKQYLVGNSLNNSSKNSFLKND